MGLIHWWPLNGDTKDYGLNNANLVNNGATVNNSGKIGKCYSFSSNNMVVATSDITSATELSLCLWVKLSTSHSGYAQVLVLGTSGTSWNNIRCGVDINGDGKVYFNVSSGSANTYISSPLNYKDATWHHIIGVYNNGSLKLYIDGTQVATGTTTNVPGLSGTSIYVGGNAGGEKANNGDCLNDVRVYNHALSVKEVKEISKGLVLHYDFEDEESEPTSNILSSAMSFPTSGWGAWKASGDASTCQFLTGDAAIGNRYLKVTLAAGSKSCTAPHFDDYSLTANTTYTYSCYVKGDTTSVGTSITWHCNPNGIAYSNHKTQTITLTGEWQRVSSTITITETPSGSKRCQPMISVGDAAHASNAINIYSCNFQKEVKDHVTPWVEGGKSRSSGMLYDNSGYGYNGTPINNPQIIESNGGSGSKCVRLLDAANGYFDLGTATFNFITSGTICFWARYPSNNNKMILGASDGGSRYFAAYNSSDNVWYSNLNGGSQGSIYCDGVARNNPIFDDAWHFYAFTGVNLSNWGSIKYFLCIYANNPSNGYQFHGYLADFKIYATALSATDITAEYNRKAAIDRNGNLFTGQVINNNVANIKVDKSGFVAGNNFVEGSSVAKFADKYTALEYIQNTGTTTISTGYQLDMDNDTVEIEFQATTNDQNGMIFASTSSHYFWLYHYNGSSKISLYIDNGEGQNHVGGPAKDTNRHIALWEAKKYYVDNVYIGNQTRSLGTTTTQIFLFAYDAGGSYPYKGKIYRCRIWNTTQMVRDLIPAKRNSDSVIGMYDLANRKFYAPTGSGTFTAGPEIGSISAIYANQIIEN